MKKFVKITEKVLTAILATLIVWVALSCCEIGFHNPLDENYQYSQWNIIIYFMENL